MLTALCVMDWNASFQILRWMPFLTQDSIGREWRKRNLFLKKFLQGDLWLAVENVVVRNPSDSRKLKPLMVEPVLDLNDENFFAIILLEQPDRHPFNDGDELGIVCRIGPDGSAHTWA